MDRTQHGKGMYVEQVLEMDDNLEVRGLFAISKKDVIKEYRGGYFFVLELSDRTGRVEARVWGGSRREDVEKVHAGLKVGEVVEVYGRMTSYRDTPYLSISLDSGRLTPLDEGDYNQKDFINESERDRFAMMNDLKDMAEGVKNPAYRALLESFFADSNLADRFAFMPASKLYHHAYIGGLLEHTLGVLNASRAIGRHYEGIDMDLLTTAAIFHDLGKIYEYRVTGIIDFSLEGNMLGQIYLTQRAVSALMDRAGVDPKSIDMVKLMHVILSHHGTVEKGSFIKPMVPEAVILYHADQLDSRTKAVIEVRDELATSTEEDVAFASRRDISGSLYLR